MKTFDSYFRSWKPKLLLPHDSSCGLSALVCRTIFNHRLGQQGKSYRAPFRGAECLSLGTTSPLLRAHRAQAQPGGWRAAWLILASALFMKKGHPNPASLTSRAA